MGIKIPMCLFLLVAFVSLTTAQKKKTTLTGNLSKDIQTGTRADIGISHRRGNWDFNGSGFGTSRGHRGGSLGASYKRKNFQVGGSIFGDNRGNKGFNVGLKWRFRRSTKTSGEHFDVILFVNQCNFNVYDKNDDGVITLDEMLVLFSDRLEAERLFNVIDITNDGVITVKEFDEVAPQVINRCEQPDKGYTTI